MKVTKRITVSVLAVILTATALSSCASNTPEQTSSSATTAPTIVRVGTMPTEDILPLWAAEKDALSVNDAQLGSLDSASVEVVVFDSAPALSAAIASGEVNMAMTDIMRAAKLTESGTPVTLEWTTLGETPEQGRFGVVAAANAPYSTLQELADYVKTHPNDTRGVGVGANTVPEYVFDKLCEQAGINPKTLPIQEVASVPERFGLMASDKLLAAALPGSLVALAEVQGMKVLADDTQGDNISQSVMIARSDWAATHEQEILAVAALWDAGAAAVNGNGEAYRSILAERANLNAAIVETYPVSTYPRALSAGKLAHPAEKIVQPVLSWMASKEYGGKVSYDAANGQISAQA